jgi:hypothetical protein
MWQPNGLDWKYVHLGHPTYSKAYIAELHEICEGKSRVEELTLVHLPRSPYVHGTADDCAALEFSIIRNLEREPDTSS